MSTDYLLGKTEIPSSDMKTREVCEYTGLSEDTVILLSTYSSMNTQISSFIARFFEDIITGDSLTIIYDSLIQSARANAIAESNVQTVRRKKIDLEIENIMDSINGTHGGYFKISARDAAGYFLALAQTLAKGSIDAILEIMEEELCETYISEGGVSQEPEKRIWRLIEDDDE